MQQPGTPTIVTAGVATRDALPNVNVILLTTDEKLLATLRDVSSAHHELWQASSADAAVEFDGKTKYTRNEFTKGDPAEVVWREKKREDRLRRQVRTVVRVLTSDVRTPSLLDAKLRDAGIHRGRRE